MNAFNRTFLVVYSLLWIAACAGLAALAWNDHQKLDLSLGSVNLQAFILSGDTDRWIFTAILVLLALLGFITLLTAFKRSPGVSRGYVRLQSAEGGIVDVSASAVEALIRTEIETIPQVHQAAVLVRVSGGAIHPDIAASIDPAANIADITHAISERTALALREQLGATRVHRPVLHLTHDEEAGRAAARARSQPAVPPEGDLPPPPPMPGPQPFARPPVPAPPRASSDPLPQPPRDTNEAPSVIVSPPTREPGLPPPPPASDGDSEDTVELPVIGEDDDQRQRHQPEYGRND